MTYPWASGEVLTAADLNSYAGLVLVKTQTVGSTAVASVAVSNAFSSQYRNYHIVYTGGNFVSIGSGSSAQLQITMTGMTSNVRTTLMYVLTPFTTLQVTSGTAAEFGFFGGGNATSVYGACTLYAPNLAEYTRYVSSTYTPQGTMAGVGNAWGIHEATTQHTGFSIVVSDSGTIANGTINVYGFNNG